MYTTFVLSYFFNQEIDIKKQGAVSSYAFCQYSDICSVVKAMRSMDGEHLGSNRIKLGFGKSMPTSCVWVDGIGGNCIFYSTLLQSHNLFERGLSVNKQSLNFTFYTFVCLSLSRGI